MSSTSVFLKPEQHYQRKIDPIGQYVDQNTFYLHRSTGEPIEVCRDYIVSSIKQKKFVDVRDPKVIYFERGENLDREDCEISLSQYFKTAVADDQIIAPTLTTYVPPSRDSSLLTEYTDINKKMRSVVKKKAQQADAQGNKELYIALNNEQDNYKRFNNALSGIFNANGNILNNPTAHSTLTTITRTLSSLSNASNEKIISGNRHYRDPDVTLMNVISICSSIDASKFEPMMRKYKLHYPSVEEVMDTILYSSRLYWIDNGALTDIIDFVKTLTPLERAGFVYIGDLYHIRKYNPGFVKRFLTQLSSKTHDITITEPLKLLKDADELVINYAHQVCLDTVAGKGKDYETLLTFDEQVTLASTVNNIVETVECYRDFIDEIFLTENLPMSTAYITTMLRRCVVLSDTDSTMFSVDEWVAWYFGKLEFSEKGFALAGSIMFIATQVIAHSLAVFSANMGVERKKLFALAMKPEFCFPVFGNTLVAKHYYTMQLIKEGVVRKVANNEFKGVHIKNSAVPSDIIHDSHVAMRSVLDRVMAGSRISAIEELKKVAEVETRISDSIMAGQTKFYKRTKIKHHSAYGAEPEKSPYQYHIFWQEVFEPKYGKVEEPIYMAVKIPTTLRNKTALKNWLASMPDKDMANRLSAWIERKGRSAINNFYLSKEFVDARGLPDEIATVVNRRKVMLEMTMSDRIRLESLGIAPKSGLLLSEIDYAV